MTSELAKRYAKSFYEIAKAYNDPDLVFSELRVIKAALKLDAAVSEFLISPVVGPKEKQAVLEKSLKGKVSETVLNGLLLLVQKNRIHVLFEIVDAYEAISDEDHEVTRGTVRSATALSADSRKKIEETVTKVTKKKVILNFTEDSSLLGGMIAQVGGWTFDDSLETHLTRMSEYLNRRAH